MKDTIYLTISKGGVQSMRKSYTGSKKGEIVAKLEVGVADDAFQPPVIEKSVYIDDWHQGIDLEDVKFEKNTITEEEAEEIRQKRIEKMISILTSQGYTIEEAEEQLEVEDNQ